MNLIGVLVFAAILVWYTTYAARGIREQAKRASRRSIVVLACSCAITLCGAVGLIVGNVAILVAAMICLVLVLCGLSLMTLSSRSVPPARLRKRLVA